MNEEDLLNENFNLKNKINEIQNQFQAIFEQTSDGIFIANSEGNYIDVNQTGCEILGYSKEEILGKNLKDLLTKEEIDIKPIKYAQLGSSKTSISIRKMLHKSGKIIYVEVSGKKLDNGNLIETIKDITDYDILSKKLKASEEMFSKIFKLTPNALSIISMENGKVLEVNDEALKISDYSREELLSTPNLQNNLWADHSEKERLILKLSIEGYLKNEEVLVKSKSNKLYNCLLSSEFIELDNKMYVLNLLNDFTKQKQIQEKLNNERKNLKTLIETLPDLIWVKDINGVYLSCNNKFEKFIGYKESEIIGKTDYDFVERDLAEFFRENDRKALENNRSTTNLEWLTFASDGHKELVQTIKTPLYDYSNELVGVLGIARNITDLYEAQEKLAEREEVYSAIVNNASDSIALIDPENGNIIEFNEATYKTLGYTKEEFKGINIIDINTINSKNEILDIHNKIISENISKTFETKHRCKDGSIIDVRISMKNIKLKNKDYIVSIGSDITEQKQKEKELLELTNSLKNAQSLAKIGSWNFDLINNIATWSDEMYKIFEVDKNNFKASYEDSISLMHPEDKDMVNEAFTRAVKEKKLYDIVHRILMKDGRIKYLHEKCITEYNETGEAVRSFGTTQDITEKKLIEIELQETQEKYKLIAENVDDVIWILDPIKMKFNYVSPSIEKLRGYTPEEVCKQSMEEVVTPESYKKLSEILPERIKDFYENQVDLNSSEITEIYQPTKSGEIVTTEVVTKFILDKKTNSIQVLGVSRNITERKKIENEIKESNEKFHKIFNDSPLSNSIAELKTQKFIEINQKFLDMIKFTREEVIGKTSLDLDLFYEKKERDIFLKLLNENRKIPELKVKIKTKNNELLDCLIYSEIIKINNREHIVSIIQNITEKLKTEQEIKRLSRLYLISSEINKILLKATNQNQVFEDICKIAVEFGNFRMAWIGLVDPESSIVKPVVYYGFEDNYLSIIPQISIKDIPEGRGPTGSSIREKKFFVNNDMENNSLMNPWKNEALKRSYRSSISIPIISNNKAIGAFTLYSDETYFFNEKEINLILEVTNSISYSIEIIELEKIRKQNEEEINRLNIDLENRVRERTIQLENSNKDLEAFAYSVSHDLRAPLRHIDGFTNLLKAKLPIHNEESDKYIKKITTSSKKMSLMIDELLKFSRLGRKTLEKNKVCLNTIISQVIEQYKPDYYNRKINFEIEKLPEVLGDPILLQSVFQNIISNAIKFTSKKEEAIIKIGLINKDNKKMIYIKDNGAGFDMAYSDKLFGVFQRLHSENDFSGTGIGLANVKQIITKHGWTIHAESEIDKGATFFITLDI